MATQDSNVVQYEFRGNTLPLEKAFAQVGKLFRRYIREAKEAAKIADPINNPKGILGKDEQDLIKELKSYYKRLKVLSDKSKVSLLSDEEDKEARQILKKMLTRSNQFLKMRNKLQREADRELRKTEEKQREVKDWTATSSQFKAGVQAEQLDILAKSLPRLPANIIADINSYVEAWKLAKQEFDGSEAATERLSTATKNLDEKAREYSATLKTMIKNQKSATNEMEHMLSRVINMVTSFEWWYRVIRDGITLLGDYVESLNFVSVAINNIKWGNLVDGAQASSDALEELTEDLDQARWALGLNATDTNTAAATYISFANAMNMTGDAVTKFGQNMTQLSIDMASLYNKDVIVMMTALRSGLAGNTRALMNYGISVHDATLNEWMYSKGLDKTMTKLSETSQMMVRYMYILEKTNAAQGDLNRTLKSPANQLRVLKNQVNLLKQNLGALFNLVIYPAIRMLNEILIPINAFISAMTELANEGYSTAIGNTSDAFDDLSDSIENASNEAKGLSNLDEINQLTASNTTTKIGIDADIQALFDAIEVYGNFTNETSKLTEVMKSLGEAMAPVWQILTNSAALDAFAGGLNAIGVALMPIKNILDGFREWFGTWPEWLQTVFNYLGAIVGTFVSLATAITVAAAALSVFITLSKAAAMQNFIKTLGKMVQLFLDLTKAILLNLAKFAKWVAAQIIIRAEMIKTTIQIWLQQKAYWKLAIAAIAALGVAGLAVAGAVAAATAVMSGIEARNNAMPNVPNIPNIPQAANGGVAKGPTFALVGEGAYNEAIVPLGNSPQFESMKESIAERVIERSGGGGGVQDLPARPIVLSIDGRELGRAQINDISRVRRQVGVGLK